MKVLVVNKFFFLKGGAETVFFQEREMLMDRGFSVIDFSMAHNDNLVSDYSASFVNNVDYHANATLLSALKTAMRFVHNIEACEKLSELIATEQPDIVHFHNIYHQLTPSIIKVAKQAGCKTVLTAHDTKIACPSYTMYRDGHTCEACLQGSVFNALRYRCQQGSWFKSGLLVVEALYQSLAQNYQSLDVIVSPSQFLANIIRRKLPNNRIEVIVNGINENVDQQDVADHRYFLYLGRLSQEKGVATMVAAYELSNQSIPLKIAGTGPLADSLSGKQSKVEWLGFKTGLDLHLLIKQASAVIVPSECYENCSMSVLEAMSYGKPIIGANIGGIPEQVRDGKEGRLFEAGNAHDLANVMDEFTIRPELTKYYGEQARQRLESRYSLRAHHQQLVDLYQNLLSEQS
ncbi:Glycosyltransferase involved in cell wall biosynthesis [Vibrio crassostreae]|uniref:glycosyltransferase family 4 protein n=1 Tax=Vibrio crassostreae TaxID=246167 RepID=UPI001047EDE0|nr:glycosyltransferase family 4 protein [Vibrio crassostreae]TCN81633.1 glycosyltransferase involved in cell wall biosynthesis [Vibrio crassostreae]CAK2461478.1 Glycosyltransferase involved in cell wall biosynthesis [Vibrio crassostreae]CAK2468184.1 Glycosyltransferase involved in cell wall biosynthesis [Vibrio crassostreae]CAK2729145.1 Glycosyltransferase involved in cell wall biosynthesis [Vibrio crassostreae]CAK3242567.1 Glycosyltransferase involved in cell wall biosynthesis [Vibrio crassos